MGSYIQSPPPLNLEWDVPPLPKTMKQVLNTIGQLVLFFVISKVFILMICFSVAGPTVLAWESGSQIMSTVFGVFGAIACMAGLAEVQKGK